MSDDLAADIYCNTLILSIISFLPPARLSEIYAFSYSVHHIAHRTGPKEVLEGVENRCQTFLTTYKQIDHIPPPEYGLNYL